MAGLQPSLVFEYSNGRRRPFLPSVKLRKSVRYRPVDADAFIVCANGSAAEPLMSESVHLSSPEWPPFPTSPEPAVNQYQSDAKSLRLRRFWRISKAAVL
jgi:hypothetical protein